jgi:predicted RNase H-like HicB family nuclease
MSELKELGEELNSLLDAYLNADALTRMDCEHELTAALWDNKSGIVAALRAYAPETPMPADDYYSSVIVWSEEYQAYLASTPELPGCIADGQTKAEALRQLADARAAWIEAAKDIDKAVPVPTTFDAFPAFGAERANAMPELADKIKNVITALSAVPVLTWQDKEAIAERLHTEFPKLLERDRNYENCSWAALSPRGRNPYYNIAEMVVALSRPPKERGIAVK